MRGRFSAADLAVVRRVLASLLTALAFGVPGSAAALAQDDGPPPAVVAQRGLLLGQYGELERALREMQSLKALSDVVFPACLPPGEPHWLPPGTLVAIFGLGDDRPNPVDDATCREAMTTLDQEATVAAAVLEAQVGDLMRAEARAAQALASLGGLTLDAVVRVQGGAVPRPGVHRLDVRLRGPHGRAVRSRRWVVVPHTRLAARAREALAG